MLEGDVLMAAKKPDLAVKAYEQAFTISQSGATDGKVACIAQLCRKRQRSRLPLDQMAEGTPCAYCNSNLLAGTYLAEKQYKEAIEQYETILRQEPKYVPALNTWLGFISRKRPPRLGICRKSQSINTG